MSTEPLRPPNCSPWHPELKWVRAAIKDMRIESGMTFQEFGLTADYDYRSILRFVHGYSDITVSKLLSMLDALGYEMEFMKKEE